MKLFIKNIKIKKIFILFCFLVLIFLNLNLLFSANSERSVYLSNKDRVIRKLALKYDKEFYDMYYLFNQVYLSVIDAYYYDKYSYSVEDLSFCKLFSLVIAMIEAESSFNPKAVAKKGKKITGVGLMQINYSFWKNKVNKLKLSYLYDPYLNVRYGLRIFFLEYKKSKSIRLTLKKYVGAVNNLSVFNRYYKKIMKLKKYYENLFCE